MALQVTQVKSSNGAKHNQLATLETLGLRRIRHTVVVPDRPEFRGMVAKINHLVAVTEVADDKTVAATASRALTPSDAGEPGLVGGEEGASAKAEAMMEEQGVAESTLDSNVDLVQLPQQKHPSDEKLPTMTGGFAEDEDEDEASDQPSLIDEEE